MNYSFLFGPSGSGKTSCAFREMAEDSLSAPGKRFFILVPEQHGMLEQKRLLMLHPRHASGNVEVMSFNRLAYRVFAELNIRNPEFMDDSGKAMVLRRVASERAGALLLWRDRMKKAGFTENVKSMISECFQYGVRPEDLRRASEQGLPLPLRRKLSDLSVLYEGFRQFIEGKSLPKEELLQIFADHIEESTLLRGAVFLFDGFTGFTPVQYRIIERLFAVAERLRFVVTIGREADPYHRTGEEALFHMSAEMTARLIDLGSKNGAVHDRDVVLKTALRFPEGGALDFLERHFLRYDGEIMRESPAAIRLLAAANPAGEVSRCAEEILRLVKREGCRYRDIAVVAADFESYAPLLQHELRQQEIPCYFDRRLSVAANPLPELLRAALSCVTESFSGRSFLRFMKSGLVTEDREGAALCDSYMSLCGIRGFQKLSAPWEYVPPSMREESLSQLNALKDEVLSLLIPLRELFKEREATVGELARCLRELMEKLKVQEKLAAMHRHFEETQDAEHAREFQGVYDETVRILLEMELLLGEERLGREDMSGVLDAGLNEIRVGQIPAFADRVVVGDLMRSRLGEIRYLFLLGANDGVLPKRKQEGGVLTDRERESLKRAGIQLAPTAREDLGMQRYYLYRVLTQPSRGLYLSFAAQDSAGHAQSPSGIVNHIQSLFPELQPETARAEEPELLSSLMAERRLLRELRALRDREPQGREEELCFFERFLPAYCEEKTQLDRAETLISAACFRHEAERLAPEAARALYGELIQGSVTRMEEFCRCPYSHFLKYGLKLRELQSFSIESQDIGTLVHRALELVFRAAGRSGSSLPELTAAEREELVERCIAEALSEDRRGLYRDSARNVWLIQKLSKLVKRGVAVMTAQLSRGDYRPLAAELTFSAEKNAALEQRLPQGILRLGGKVDRVDLCEDGDRIYVKIVDYKTGKTGWEPYRILSGSQLQLLIYLDAVTALLSAEHPEKRIVPGALFYAPVADSFCRREKVRGAEEAFRESLKDMKPSGLLNVDDSAMQHLSQVLEEASDILPVRVKDGALVPTEQTVSERRFGLLREYARRRVSLAGSEILSGAAEALPLEEERQQACDYCPYGAVCGFDRKLPGYGYRRNRKRAAQEVWEEIDRKLLAGTAETEKQGTEEGAV